MAGHGIYDKIYNNAPIWFQNIMISAYGYKLKQQRYGKVYHEYLEYLKSKDYSDINEAKEMQNKEFLKLLHYAVEHSAFYKRFYKDIDISSIKSVDDITKLPILDKETLRQNIEDVYTIKQSDGILSFTGGTTGKSLCVVFTNNDMQKRMALLSYFEYDNGISLDSKRATFNGRQIVSPNNKHNIYWRNNWWRHQRLYSSFDLSDNNIASYIDNLNKYKPEVINGFVSAIYVLSQYIERYNIKLSFVPKCIFTTSETLLPFHRKTIESAFRCPVRNQYASSEGAPFITECKHGMLHYDITSGIIESINGEMIITSFTSYGTPLIRYRIGDSLKFANEQIRCKCNCSYPIVESIEGRKVDFLYSSDKKQISLSHLADVIKGFPNCVMNMQFVQNTFDQIDIYMVVDNNSYKKEYDDLIIKEMIYRFGDKMKFVLHKVDKIEREKSGKYRLIKNNLESKTNLT